MKKSYIYNLIILFITTNFCYCQNIYQVEYKMTTLFDGLKNYEAKLTFSEQESCFEFKLFESDSVIVENNDKNGHKTIAIPYTRQQSINVNLREKKIRELKHFKSAYLVEDTLSLPQWDITNEVRTISNHQCQKATTTYKGRTYEVWFTNEYPTIYGPWKLNGLPGLIILAHDKKNEVIFEAVEIQKIDKNICHIDNSAKHISRNEFEKLIKNWQKDYEERLKSMGNRSIQFDVNFENAVDIEILD